MRGSKEVTWGWGLKEMDKKDAVWEVSRTTGFHTQNITRIIEALFDVIRDANRIEFRGFGVFEWVKKPAKNHGEKEDPERLKLKFTPSIGLSGKRKPIVCHVFVPKRHNEKNEAHHENNES